jgi:hypothetical protein
MFAKFSQFVRTIFTEDDANQVWCPVRVFGGVGAMSEVILTGAHAIYNHAFDPTGFGTGFAAILAAIGAGVGIKAKLGG